MAFEKPYVFEEAALRRGKRPLMPSAMANNLRDRIRSALGVFILIILAAVWLSLMSWSIQDPSYFHTTSRGASNWLGTLGANAADLILQAFGMAALVLLLAPMMWALAMLQYDIIGKFARRSLAYVASVLLLAAAASAVPQPANWPLHAGLGGIVGDAIIRVASPAIAASHADIARPVTAVLLLALGGWLASFSIGVTRQRYVAEKTIRTKPRSVTITPSVTPHVSQRVEPVLTVRPTATAPPRHNDRFGPYADAAFEPAIDDLSDPDFDSYTDAVSSGIAARFAPQTAHAEPHLEPAWPHPAHHASYRHVAPNAPHAMHETLADAFPAPGFDDHPAHDPYETLPLATVRTASTTALARTQAYKRPSLNLLERPAGSRAKPGYTEAMLRGNARLLEDVLADFGVIGEIRDIIPGPVVTIYELEAARGTNPARVISLSDDIARGMSVPSVRIAPIQGRATLSVELPNQIRETVMLRDVFDADVYRSTMDVLPVALGRSVEGRPIVADLARTPHMLVAGTNGSGKSTGINAMILSLLYKHGPDDCRFLMIDPKMLDLAAYNGIPHLLTPVVTDPHKAITALAWCVTEMEERYKRMAALGVRNIDVFNNRVRNAKKRGERLARTIQTGFDKTTGQATYVHEDMNLEPMPFIVIVMDEFADLMAVAGRDIEGAVKRLAEAAKAAGIHLIMATERPSTDIATPALKPNLAARISYKAASKLDSRAVLNTEGAEQLLGAGDMLYANGTGSVQRVHGPYVSQEEINAVASSLRQQSAPRYVEGLTGPDHETAPLTRTVTPDPSTARPLVPVSDDALYDRAVATIIRDRQASIPHLQRRLNISPAWAASLLQRLEHSGLIGPANPQGNHQIRVGAAA